MSLDWAIRYAPIIRFIKSQRPSSVLEVGSGPQGLAYYLRDVHIVGTDLRFGDLPLKNIRPVIASSTALPFRENAFDMVISSDMMEHLPEKLRSFAMNEMLRVANKIVVVGFPSGPIAKEHDLALSSHIKSRGMKLPIWLGEHLENEYPNSESVLRGLPLASMRCRVVGNANWRLHKTVVLLQMHYYFNRVVRFFRLDSMNLMIVLGRFLDWGQTYREIIFLEAKDPLR